MRLREGFGHRLYQLAQFGGGDEHCPSADVRSERFRLLAWLAVRKVVVAHVEGDFLNAFVLGVIRVDRRKRFGWYAMLFFYASL